MDSLHNNIVSLMSISELTAGAKYENLLQREFEKAKKQIPIKPFEEIQAPLSTTPDTQRLQVNLAREKLKQIIDQPALITLIIEDLKITEGDLVNYVKYADLFKKSLGTFKIKKLEDFRTSWDLFQKQNIGTILQPEQKVEIFSALPEEPVKTASGKELTIDDALANLQVSSTETIDNLFRKAISLDTKKDVADVDAIRYRTYDGKESELMTLLNKDGIIKFKPNPRGKKSDITKINEVKIRYILQVRFPKIKRKNMSIDWVGEASSSSTTGTGLGLLQNNNPFQASKSLKKKLARMALA